MSATRRQRIQSEECQLQWIKWRATVNAAFYLCQVGNKKYFLHIKDSADPIAFLKFLFSTTHMGSSQRDGMLIHRVQRLSRDTLFYLI